jgi:hypothetical protein
MRARLSGLAITEASHEITEPLQNQIGALAVRLGRRLRPRPVIRRERDDRGRYPALPADDPIVTATDDISQRLRITSETQ